METSPATGVIERAAAVLRAVSARASAGASTTEIARTVDLARPTVHRLLTTMADEGWVDRDARSGRWTLGPELYLLGAGAAARYDIVDHARDIVDHLARESGESAFLSARRGDETVCIHSQEGSFPLRSHVLHVGLRLPLGVASAGLVILGHLPDREIDEYLDRVSLEGRWGPEHSGDGIRERIAQTRETGYATNPALLVEGSWGMGAAVFDGRDRPTWALSLTGVETRFRPDRRIELGQLLLEQAHRLTVRLR
ncbi:IclR family transcriptional regulator [Gordonia desulfuricans]|uniref:Glycerol operon regulatory protein n=1 Tax=Gordonia desulfuricans TaxID=89051 RepID=A0A7K3LTL7_9ACTN|nr:MULTISPECIES: IclR family transcriptional regulator [Gordonia]EMP14235.1 IclR family transcriptional regulator [Gordonia sp. NB41Y]NDK91593.1 IclR family transcriptional regulator [Gordonia desulfuricans]WLP88714.1 IclR family transcriptional regulator [Gordonia sp. NB41Y]